ncbi:hypothetical protein DFH09DRAFT_1081759 [Mycena vulgaris]|nr:hypothetical protein DFH09DRAFT_1081759 [Mycena vulgaris]
MVWTINESMRGHGYADPSVTRACRAGGEAKVARRVAWASSFPSPCERELLGALTGGYSKEDYNPMVSTLVPSFWAVEQESTADNGIVAAIIECFIGSIFGAIHCAAWSVDFPLASEMRMWRACSLMVTAIPVILPVAFLIPAVTIQNDMIETILAVISAVVIPSYIIARLFLLTLPFTTLRALSPADVNWSGIYSPGLSGEPTRPLFLLNVASFDTP